MKLTVNNIKEFADYLCREEKKHGNTGEIFAGCTVFLCVCGRQRDY